MRMMLRKPVRQSDQDLVAVLGCFPGPAFKALPVSPNSTIWAEYIEARKT